MSLKIECHFGGDLGAGTQDMAGVFLPEILHET